MQSALTNAAAAEQQRGVALTELEDLRAQLAEGSVRLAEVTAESAAVKEHAKNQLQKAIEKIKALTANVDNKGQEVAQLQQTEVRLTEKVAVLKDNEVRLTAEVSHLQETEVRLTEEIADLKGNEVRLTEQIQQLRENEVRLSSSSGEVAAALQVRVTELEQAEVSLGQQLAEVRAHSQEHIQAIQGTHGQTVHAYIQGWW